MSTPKSAIPEQAYAVPPTVAFFHLRRTTRELRPAVHFAFLLGGLACLPVLAAIGIAAALTSTQKYMRPGTNNRPS